jgi:putative ABC transport system substrate-binding protein
MQRTTVGLIIMLALGILVAPVVVMAQPRWKLPQVSWLDEGRRVDKADLYAVFLQALRELGYVEGQNLTIVRRDAEGQLDRLPALAAELASSRSTSL